MQALFGGGFEFVFLGVEPCWFALSFVYKPTRQLCLLSDTSILCLPSVRTHSLGQKPFCYEHCLSGTLFLMKSGQAPSHSSDHLLKPIFSSSPTNCMCVCVCVCVCVREREKECVCVWPGGLSRSVRGFFGCFFHFCLTYFVSCNGPCALKEKWHRKNTLLLWLFINDEHIKVCLWWNTHFYHTSWPSWDHRQRLVLPNTTRQCSTAVLCDFKTSVVVFFSFFFNKLDNKLTEKLVCGSFLNSISIDWGYDAKSLGILLRFQFCLKFSCMLGTWTYESTC